MIANGLVDHVRFTEEPVEVREYRADECTQLFLRRFRVHEPEVIARDLSRKGL